MKVRLNEVDFSNFENDDFDIGEKWVDDLPKEILDFIAENRGDNIVESRGFRYGYFVSTSDGGELYFLDSDGLNKTIIENLCDCGWENAFHKKDRNIDIMQSRYPGMIPTEYMRDTIEDHLRKIEIENGNEEAEDLMYILDKYMDTDNGLTCTDTAIRLLTNDRDEYASLMDDLMENDETVAYFADEYGYYDYPENFGYEYIGGDWYICIDG